MSRLDDLAYRADLLSAYHKLLIEHWDELSDDARKEIDQVLAARSHDLATLARNLKTLLKQNGIEVPDED